MNARARTALLTAGLLLSAAPGEPADAAPPARVKALKITVLVTNLAGDAYAGGGEWGFAALVEADGHRILYDTGASPDLALRNAQALKIDNYAEQIKAEYEATGGKFVVHDGPAELFPGVWLTGPVPRAHPEHNWQPGVKVDSATGPVEDTLAEDSALAFSTGRGFVVLTGCGHAGIVNIAEAARRITSEPTLLAVIGGLHLYNADDTTLGWTAGRLKQMGLENLLAAHCTGIESTWRLRRELGLARETAVVGAVGASFTLGRGIDPLALAR